MKHLESIQQAQVIEWSRWAYKTGKYPMLNMLHCSLNGVKLSGTQAKIAKGQGMLSGVPDLFLPVPKNGYHGLFIEMKSEKRCLTENQQWFLGNAESVGYKTVVCYDSKEAIAAIQAYYEQQKV